MGDLTSWCPSSQVEGGIWIQGAGSFTICSSFRVTVKMELRASQDNLGSRVSG